MANALAPERLGQALAAIARWRLHPDLAIACPVCGAKGIIITDHSARPYAEWYALKCEECDLDATVHIPLAPPSMF